MGKRAKAMSAFRLMESRFGSHQRRRPGQVTAGGPRMDALGTLLAELKKSGRPEGNFLGFLHVLIGRSLTRLDDKFVVSKGMTWRDLAGWLKKVRWDPEAVREQSLEPDSLPPRDRQRY